MINSVLCLRLGLENVQQRREAAGVKVNEWQTSLKTKGGFSAEKKVLDAVQIHFTSERVSDVETVATSRDVYRWPNTPGSKGYILDPHSAVSVTAALRSAKAVPGVHNVVLGTALPAKFSRAVERALAEEKGFQFKEVFPPQFFGLKDLPRRVAYVHKSGGLDGLTKLIVDEVDKERALNGKHA